jgi:hypothetical protein
MKEGEKGELVSKAEARYTVEAYYKGFRLLLTLPFENGGVIVGVLDKMAELGFTGDRVLYQAPQLPTQETVGNGNGKETEAHTCTIHNVEMKKYEKDSRSWYAHRNGDQWCNGKKK